MTSPALSHVTASRPLRRGAAGGLGGFVACLAIEWIERAVHLLGPLTNLSIVLVDITPAAVWAVLCLAVFAVLRSGATRSVVLSVVALPFLALVAWLNASSLHGPGAIRVLLPTIVLVLTVGIFSALLGNRIDALWREREASEGV